MVLYYPKIKFFKNKKKKGLFSFTRWRVGHRVLRIVSTWQLLDPNSFHNPADLSMRLLHDRWSYIILIFFIISGFMVIAFIRSLCCKNIANLCGGRIILILYFETDPIAIGTKQNDPVFLILFFDLKRRRNTTDKQFGNVSLLNWKNKEQGIAPKYRLLK